MTDTVLAWYFCPESRRLANGDGREIIAGETLSVEPPIVLCRRGLHGSERAIDALSYAESTIICRVELSGEIARGDDKLVAQHRKTLWIADATRELHLFACDVAERALERERNMGERQNANHH